MAKKVKIPNRQVEPPKMERDPLTGKYIADKRTVITTWFKSAKNSGSDTDEYNWDINPKQAVYNNHQEAPPAKVDTKPTTKKKK
jgi:hypothetical protein